MNYEEFLVPVSIAKELKEIGFNEPCLFVLNPHNTLILSSEVHDKGIIDIRKIKPRSNGKLGEDFCSVPTYEQVFKWFGEKGYTCHFAPVKQPPMYIGSRYAWSYEVLNNGKVITCDTYKDARLECIRELIRIYKNGNKRI